MIMVIAAIMVLLMCGCADRNEAKYPDECFRVVTHVNNETDYIADLEAFPCRRTRDSYHWDRKP